MAEGRRELYESLSLADRESAMVLLLTPTLSTHAETACMELCTVTQPQQENLLVITVTQSPTDWLDQWRSHVGNRSPANACLISVDEETQATTNNSDHSNLFDSCAVETVASTADLTGIGVALTTYLPDWGENSHQTVLCFHSVTTLLQYVDLQQVFKFLHVMAERLRNANTIAHVHCDPTAHDQQTLNTLKQVFDATVEIDQEGNRTITTRSMSEG